GVQKAQGAAGRAEAEAGRGDQKKIREEHGKRDISNLSAGWKCPFLEGGQMWNSSFRPHRIIAPWSKASPWLFFARQEPSSKRKGHSREEERTWSPPSRRSS